MNKKLLAFFITAIYPFFSTGQLNKQLAEQLAELPLRCIHQEFPNKTSHSADGPEDAVLLPQQLHPVFYGCFDWHSSVHGHWMLVKLLKQYPDMENSKAIWAALENSFQLEKMKEEASYFTKYSVGKNFERTYGWAWLLKLDLEIKSWNHPQSKKLQDALQPLTDQIVSLWKEYLPKQTYPNRTGVHPNTAFALSFALDWARTVNDKEFEVQIIEKARYFYESNKNIPAYLEPDGSDFFSPSLTAADLMRRIYPKDDYVKWINEYYDERSIQQICNPPVVSDRNDYQIVHLDGLYFSRAWCMKGIADYLPDTHPLKLKFQHVSQQFLDHALDNMFQSNYGGSHWLASFAVYAME